ncbi:MAG TPA: hypothetical protein PKN32_13965 [Bacteroidales bacterium]|nr:hypothetical protein [Bacteroidales bacterium]
MKIHIKSFLIIPLLMVRVFLFAQEIPVSIKVLKDTIIIGEQTELQIEIQVPKTNEIIFPVFKDTISKNIDLIKDSKPIINESDEGLKTYQKSYVFTSFDTGLNYIPPIKLKYVNNSDTNDISTAESQIFVKPYVLLDTIPVDTIYANRAGFIVYGKDGFKKEIEQYIPDSIKQSLSEDSLNILKNSIKEQLLNLFSSELTQHTGLYNQEEIIKIAESSAQKMYIVDKSGILDEYIVAGSVDTVFVQEYQQVTQNQPLFTLYRIKDIKEDLYNTPFNLAEFWYYFKKYFKQYWWIILVAILIAAGLIYFLMFYKKNKKPIFMRVKPKLPAHVIALEKLEQIRKEKIWSQGKIKEFHVQITDVIREYIENRFNIYAVEMTTSEILQAINNYTNTKESEKLKLQQVLELADAVKFAKYRSLQNENDLSLSNSFEFVENTKEIIEEQSQIKQAEAEIELSDDTTIKNTEENE